MLIKENQGFDCSAFLSHGLQWPTTKGSYESGRQGPDIDGSDRDGFHTNCNFINTKSRKPRDWGLLLREEMSSITEKEKSLLAREEVISDIHNDGVSNSLSENYYESEYNSLLKWMDGGEIIVPSPEQFANKREEIQQISLRADEVLENEMYSDYPRSYNRRSQVTYNPIEVSENLGREFYSSSTCYDRRANSSTCEELANEVAFKAIETPRVPDRVMSPGGFQNFVEEQLVGFGEEKKQVYRKRRLCRHFVKGFCIRGDACDFLHDESVFCTDEQKVFLGGLPLNFTPEVLKDKLEAKGFRVLNKPKIMRGFTPKVCLGSVEEAEKLIAQRYIFIGKHRVDVRPYQDKDQLRKGLPSVVKRSVFLGGLSESTTGKMIVADLKRLDIEVVDYPVIKNGYAPRVVLGSVEHAKMLVSLKRVMVNGTVVDVRPYVNFKKRY